MDLRDPSVPAEDVVRALGLQPHPEGGAYRETWRDSPADGSRGAGTAILFLLAAGQSSHWHRVDANELWIWQAGAPLVLSLSPDGHDESACRLGPDLAAGDSLQRLVPSHCWQAAASLGGWTLVTCTVSPAFHFEGFELAPPGWRPSRQG
ncbi:cupin domain-containing protein [Limobrevibacterium gyesilva]|uniref:Cupin domain-containing protein n=1 Tax=Limobrevibacterium gyesilva TaxID=2991712 RepID=A0AA41YPE3_9PROT|nr:cupin domain-containing protein [Limobrevibacterium gyesilva]MCW3477264.1 cupin domain-containing protein [Limobrevibacterium gyesilva]